MFYFYPLKSPYFLLQMYNDIVHSVVWFTREKNDMSSSIACCPDYPWCGLRLMSEGQLEAWATRGRSPPALHLETCPHTFASATEVTPYVLREVGGESNSWPAKEGHVYRQPTIIPLMIAENSVEVCVLQNNMAGGVTSSTPQSL